MHPTLEQIRTLVAVVAQRRPARELHDVLSTLAGISDTITAPQINRLTTLLTRVNQRRPARELHDALTKISNLTS